MKIGEKRMWRANNEKLKNGGEEEEEEEVEEEVERLIEIEWKC